MKLLKIGFVLDDTLDSTDGVQQYILTLGGWLHSQGHEVHYLVGETTRTDLPHVHSLSRNTKVRFNGNHMSMPLPARANAIRELLGSEQFDILHVQMPYSPLMAGRVIAAAPERTKIIGTFHIAPNSTVVTVANRLLGAWVGRQKKAFSHVVSVSSAASAFAREAYGLETSVLPNVVNTSVFLQAEPVAKPAGTKRIMFLGRLVERKGCKILLQAVEQLVRESDGLTPFEVVICGRGPLEQELRAFTATSGLDNIVTFAGYVDDQLKARHLKAADIAVFPSTGGESFGIVLIEAMAAANPVVIGAANPGYASVLAPYPNLLVPVGNSQVLADRLRTYLTDEPARQEALQWQESYVSRFDVGVVGTQLTDIYNDALFQRQDV